MGKLTGKDKHIVNTGKVGYTQIQIPKPVNIRERGYKCKIFEMHLKLIDQQLKKNHVFTQMAISNLMVTTNPKSIIDIYTQKNENRIQTENSYQTTREQRMKGG